MIQYTKNQQLIILNNCDSATELIETKELMEQLQPLAPVAYYVYDRRMNYFLHNDKIVWILQN